jgi:hypothetical protein
MPLVAEKKKIDVIRSLEQKLGKLVLGKNQDVG